MSGERSVRAVLFDVDGTLIDSNALHVEAWVRAFEHFGVSATPEAVRKQVGKGGDQLIPVFVPPERLDELEPALSAWRSDLYAREYLPRIRPFPGVRALFERLAADGVRRVLASSAKGNEVARAEEVLGVADLVDARTTADDVEHSKPFPDIFRTALDKAATPPERTLAIGDTPYDAQAAAGAGVRTIGVLSGGFSEPELRDAGCIAIYPDLAALLADYDRSPLGA